MTRARVVSMAALLLGGCVNQDLHFYEVELQGAITTADPQLDGVGEVHVELHHARVGLGELQHPLGLVDAWTLAEGERELEAQTVVSTDDGAEGLVVYAWLDLDGDGVLCSVDGDRSEPAGVVELVDYPAHELTFAVELDEPCRGPEGLYP